MLRCGMTSIVAALAFSVEPAIATEAACKEFPNLTTLLTQPVHRLEAHQPRTAPDQAAAFPNASLKKEIVDFQACLAILDRKVSRDE